MGVGLAGEFRYPALQHFFLVLVAAEFLFGLAFFWKSVLSFVMA